MLTVVITAAHTYLSGDGKIYLPKTATQIEIDLLIMIYCSLTGHIVHAVNFNHLKHSFTWIGIVDDT